MSIKKCLGKRIRELRMRKNLTQEDLAELINMSPKSLSQIELGNNFVSEKALSDLCIALNTKPKILFDFEDTPEITIDNILLEINSHLKNNPYLISKVYKIIQILEI